MLSVDEKPHIQALEPAQGWLKLPNGKAITGFNHEFKRAEELAADGDLASVAVGLRIIDTGPLAITTPCGCSGH